jgi:RHS repeat-associated protein
MDDQSRIATLRVGDAMGDTTPATKYVCSDHLGSSNVLLDSSGTLVNLEEYYPFGETAFGSYGKKRYRYCGKGKDEESGLYYYGARYYMPWGCRFASVDPKALKYNFQSPFAYADDNPICKLDFNGEGTISPPNENASNSGNEGVSATKNSDGNEVSNNVIDKNNGQKTEEPKKQEPAKFKSNLHNNANDKVDNAKKSNVIVFSKEDVESDKKINRAYNKAVKAQQKNPNLIILVVDSPQNHRTL